MLALIKNGAHMIHIVEISNNGEVYHWEAQNKEKVVDTIKNIKKEMPGISMPDQSLIKKIGISINNKLKSRATIENEYNECLKKLSTRLYRIDIYLDDHAFYHDRKPSESLIRG